MKQVKKELRLRVRQEAWRKLIESGSYEGGVDKRLKSGGYRRPGSCNR